MWGGEGRGGNFDKRASILVDQCKLRTNSLEKASLTIFEKLEREAGYGAVSLGSVGTTRNGSAILSEEVPYRSREALGNFGTTGDDSYGLRRKRGVEYRTESLGIVITTRNDTVVLGGGGDSGHSRESLGSFNTAGDGSYRLCGKRGAGYGTESLGSSVATRNDPVIPGTSKNEIAASALRTSSEEKWKEGGLSAFSTIESGCKKIKRPEGMSDEFLRAVEETVTVVERCLQLKELFQK
jgi:hypothetical protein